MITTTKNKREYLRAWRSARAKRLRAYLASSRPQTEPEAIQHPHTPILNPNGPARKIKQKIPKIGD